MYVKIASDYTYLYWTWSYRSLFRDKTKSRINISKNPQPRTSKSSMKFQCFFMRVNHITSRDYNPIFDTGLVRYDRFPSLLYSSGATFFKIGLWYGAAASLFIPIFSVYNFFDKIFLDFLFFGLFSTLRQYSLVKVDDLVSIQGRGRVCVPKIGSGS